MKRLATAIAIVQKEPLMSNNKFTFFQPAPQKILYKLYNKENKVIHRSYTLHEEKIDWVNGHQNDINYTINNDINFFKAYNHVADKIVIFVDGVELKQVKLR
jgi:hypothetical protein